MLVHQSEKHLVYSEEPSQPFAYLLEAQKVKTMKQEKNPKGSVKNEFQ